MQCSSSAISTTNAWWATKNRAEQSENVIFEPNYHCLWQMLFLLWRASLRFPPQCSPFVCNCAWMAPYYISLNKAVLLFYPAGSLDATSNASAQSHVVQVIINTSVWVRQLRKLFGFAYTNWQYSTPTVGLLASFFLAQADITVRDWGPTPKPTWHKYLLLRK